MSRPSSSSRAVQAQAREWHIRLHSDAATEAVFARFNDWVREPAHRAAYDECEMLWADLEDNKGALAAALARRNAATIAQKPQRVWVFGAVAAAAAFAVAVFLWPQGQPSHWASYAVEKGQMQAVALSDGTIIHLNGGSRIKVDMQARLRRVVMASGEASFNVVHDAKRPFVVEVGGRRVADVGTEFNILRDEAAALLVVTVRQGAVAVSPQQFTLPPKPAEVRAGFQLIRQKGKADVIRSANADSAFAWQAGQRVYDNATLGDVLSDLNRTFPIAIRVEDPTLADLPFTGSLRIDTEDKVVRRLEAFFPVQAIKTERSILLRAKP